MPVQIHKNEKILLALISAIGGIIVAFLTYVYPKYIESKADINEIKVNNMNQQSLLRKAGALNQIAIYNSYNDLYPHLSESMQVVLTREVLSAANDSMKIRVGNYVKPIDTTENSINGSHFYYIKNQYQNGQGLTTIQFDSNNKLIYLYYNVIPQ